MIWCEVYVEGRWADESPPLGYRRKVGDRQFRDLPRKGDFVDTTAQHLFMVGKVHDDKDVVQLPVRCVIWRRDPALFPMLILDGDF